MLEQTNDAIDAFQQVQPRFLGDHEALIGVDSRSQCVDACCHLMDVCQRRIIAFLLRKQSASWALHGRVLPILLPLPQPQQHRRRRRARKKTDKYLKRDELFHNGLPHTWTRWRQCKQPPTPTTTKLEEKLYEGQKHSVDCLLRKRMLLVLAGRTKRNQHGLAFHFGHSYFVRLPTVGRSDWLVGWLTV